MSALAGIFKYDPRDRVTRHELMELVRGIDRIGPDGGDEFIDANIGIAYRGFHTTPESHREIQPLVCRGCIFSWDGRLDNREELASRVCQSLDDTITDLDLVVAAYREWDINCFAEFVGDWALAIWDTRKQELYLGRDCFGVRPLFYFQNEWGLKWGSTLEAIASRETTGLHVDKEYIAGCFYPHPPLGTTPFEEIKAILPGTIFAVRLGGRCRSLRYWALNPNSRIRYAKDEHYEEHFFELFRASVTRRLRSDRPILAELSGGLDSSAIICMADDIRRSRDTCEIETISFFNSDEPTGDERPFFTAVEEIRGKHGHHISVADFNRQTNDEAFSPVPSHIGVASPGYFAKSLRWAEVIDGVHQMVGSRVTLSGLGGDELLGGVPYEALELLENLLGGHHLGFLKQMWSWSLVKKKPTVAIVKNVLDLATAKYRLGSFLKTSDTIPWVLIPPAPRNASLKAFSQWSALHPAHLFSETIRYTLSSQLTCMTVPPVGIAEKRYPFLDRDLYAYIASIPRDQVIRAGQRRRLMRRSLQSLIPDPVLSRRSKWFSLRSPAAQFSGLHTRLESLFESPWLSAGVFFNCNAIRERIKAVEHGLVSEARYLSIAVAVEQWLQSQVARGVIATSCVNNARHEIRDVVSVSPIKSVSWCDHSSPP